jgi:predicted Na+-dependent transporter
MSLAYGATAWFALPTPQRSALTIEIGMQSGGTSIAIAAGVLDSPAMAVPAAIYSLIMYAAAFAFVAVQRTAAARGQPREAQPRRGQAPVDGATGTR